MNLISRFLFWILKKPIDHCIEECGEKCKFEMKVYTLLKIRAAQNEIREWVPQYLADRENILEALDNRGEMSSKEKSPIRRIQKAPCTGNISRKEAQTAVKNTMDKKS